SRTPNSASARPWRATSARAWRLTASVARARTIHKSRAGSRPVGCRAISFGEPFRPPRGSRRGERSYLEFELISTGGRGMWTNLALLFLRIVVGGLFVGHGTQKAFGWFGGSGIGGTAGLLATL